MGRRAVGLGALAVFLGLLITSEVGAANCLLEDGLDLPGQTNAVRLSRILSGRYLRHSAGYYRWLVGNRKKQLQSANGSRSVRELAEAYLRLRQESEAVKYLNDQRRVEPDDYNVFLALADAHFHTGRYETALAQFSRAFDRNPNGEFSYRFK